jgi:hypothetical protein
MTDPTAATVALDARAPEPRAPAERDRRPVVVHRPGRERMLQQARAARRRRELAETDVEERRDPHGALEVGYYPIVTLQYSPTTLYQVSYHIR